ncbi:hypothetical protein [Pseudoalteromonas maricaloris]|uniref:hypothetical protein n=1 Tax=Pseudoalteromonas maricaloris TaxID=184924 RepID=UPI003C17729C
MTDYKEGDYISGRRVEIVGDQLLIEEWYDCVVIREISICFKKKTIHCETDGLIVNFTHFKFSLGSPTVMIYKCDSYVGLLSLKQNELEQLKLMAEAKGLLRTPT